MPLTDHQRDHLARRLREERERIDRELARYGERFDTTDQDASGDLTKLPFHQADEGTDTYDREFDAQEVTRLSREREEIDDALERLYHDPARYGRDERTGEEIPFERLDVIPWARTRIDRRPRPAAGEADRSI